MYAYSGVLTALFERERTGQGASIEVSMLDALGEWMTQPVYHSVYGGQPPRRTGARHASISPYGPYSAAGGEQLFLGLQNDREWVVLCEKILHRPDLVNDGRFRTNPDRAAHDRRSAWTAARRPWGMSRRSASTPPPSGPSWASRPNNPAAGTNPLGGWCLSCVALHRVR
jgi:crotonobetainyl-CoA:carnitine CoA-transferase CaiB-like acyl-CoA transferase